MPDGSPDRSGHIPRSSDWRSATAPGSRARLPATETQQLLDQLAALQRTDGSIDFAFNTSTGQSVPLFRSGTIAWLGLAAVDYRATTCSTRYDGVAYGAAKWLLSEQDTTAGSAGLGLIYGGPDVSWISAQHNLLARAFLARFADEIGGILSHGKEKCAGGLTGLSGADATKFKGTLQTAVTTIDDALNRTLFVRVTPATGANAGTAYLREGVGDNALAADAQALGALWLIGKNRKTDAQAVINYANQTLYLTNRSISLSSGASSYNRTYSSSGPFAGYEPYGGSGSPNVLWMEGTLELRFAQTLLGDDTSTLDQSIANWQGVTGYNLGPLQADRTVLGADEYHVWPASAPAAWELLSLTSLSLLSGS